jgi:hypothetical protein
LLDIDSKIEKYKGLKKEFINFKNDKQGKFLDVFPSKIIEFNKILITHSVKWRDCREELFDQVEGFLNLSTEIVDKFNEKSRYEEEWNKILSLFLELLYLISIEKLLNEGHIINDKSRILNTDLKKEHKIFSQTGNKDPD